MDGAVRRHGKFSLSSDLLVGIISWRKIDGKYVRRRRLLLSQASKFAPNDEKTTMKFTVQSKARLSYLENKSREAGKLSISGEFAAGRKLQNDSLLKPSRKFPTQQQMWKLILKLSVRVVDKVKTEFRWWRSFLVATSDFWVRCARGAFEVEIDSEESPGELLLSFLHFSFCMSTKGLSTSNALMGKVCTIFRLTLA